MTKDRMKEPEDPEKGHGVVEELREEIEHVVERVPQRVRWTVRKLFLVASLVVLSLVVVVTVTAVLYVANRTEWVAKELTVLLNNTLATRSNVRIEISDLQGDPFRRVRLIEPRVTFRDDPDAPPLLEAKSIVIAYAPFSFLRPGTRPINLVIDGAVVRVGRDAEGKLRLPSWAGGKPTAPAAEGDPTTYAVQMQLHGGKVILPDKLGQIADLEMNVLASMGTETKVVVRQIAWTSGPFHTRALKLAGSAVASDSVTIAIERLETDDLALSAKVSWPIGSKQRRAHLDIERVRWGWLAEATGEKTLQIPGEARAVLDGIGDHEWQGRFSSELRWGDVSGRAQGGFRLSPEQIHLDGVNAVTNAGEIDGFFAWNLKEWELGGRVAGGDPSKWGDFGMTGWPEGDLDGEFRYFVDTRRAPWATLVARLDESTLSGWLVDRATVDVSFPAASADSFVVRMERSGGRARLSGESFDGGWRGRYVAEGFPLEEWPEGRAGGIRGVLTHGEGTVEGREGRLDVTGTLEGDSTEWLGATIASWRLEEVRGRLLPTPDLTARAQLSGVGFLGARYDSAAATLHLLDTKIGFDDVQGRTDGVSVALAGEAAWDESGWTMRLDRAVAESAKFRWVTDPPVLLGGNEQAVEFERLVARDGEARLAIEGRWATSGGSFGWRAEAHGVDLSRLETEPGVVVGGKADGVLDVRGPWDDPRWSFEMACSAPAWGEYHADTVSMALHGQPGRVEVERARLELGEGSIGLEGKIEGTERRWPDSLDVQHVIDWLAGASSWSGTVTANDYGLAGLDRLVPGAQGWSGQISGRLLIDGAPTSPEFECTVAAAPLAWHSYWVDRLAGRLRYRDRSLEVTELDMTRNRVVSRVSGRMPLVLRLGGQPEVPETPMAWRFEIPSGELSVVPLFVPQIGSASGRFDLDAKVGGTFQRPDLDGTLKVRDGRVRLAGREEILEKVYADFLLDESRITLDTLNARQGKNGRASASGVLELSGKGLESYRFDLALRSFNALESGVYAASFDGDFRITDGPRMAGVLLPLVEGEVRLERAAILFDFANQSEVQKLAVTTKPLFWTYRLQVQADNGLHWQPPDGDVEFSANLSLQQTPERLIMFGDMESLRGTYYFLSNRFSVKRADLTFDDVGGINPQLDIEAVAKVIPSTRAGERPLQQGDASAEEVHDVTVRITGRADEPVIEFSSEPPDWDQAAILDELTLGRFRGSGGVTLADPLDHYLTRAINKTLSAEMSRAFRGYVDEWQLEREQGGLMGGEGDVVIGVGSQLTPNLLVRYRQRLPGLGREASQLYTNNDLFERDFEAEYRINRFFYITSELIQRRVLRGVGSPTSGGADFNVNLKARWEY